MPCILDHYRHYLIEFIWFCCLIQAPSDLCTWLRQFSYQHNMKEGLLESFGSMVRQVHIGGWLLLSTWSLDPQLAIDAPETGLSLAQLGSFRLATRTSSCSRPKKKIEGMVILRLVSRCMWNGQLPLLCHLFSLRTQDAALPQHCRYHLWSAWAVPSPIRSHQEDGLGPCPRSQSDQLPQMRQTRVCHSIDAPKMEDRKSLQRR